MIPVEDECVMAVRGPLTVTVSWEIGPEMYELLLESLGQTAFRDPTDLLRHLLITETCRHIASTTGRRL